MMAKDEKAPIIDAQTIGAAERAPQAAAVAPAQITMVGTENNDFIEKMFGDKESLLVKQTMRGCIQECLGCEAKSEFKISAMDTSFLDGSWIREGAMTQPDEMYALENSSFCMRCCWRDGRPFVMEVSSGAEAGGRQVVNYEKPCGFPVVCIVGNPADARKMEFPCCCLLPELTTKRPDGLELSKSRYLCDCCLYVPKFAYEEDDQVVYFVRPPTCCGGCCVACTCGRKGCSVPFYFYDPETGERIKGGDDTSEPQIVKVWAGLKKECCSTADTFVIFYPRGCTSKRKAGLLGMTFLIDFTVFERQGEE